jgi:hypothetical protein
LLTVETSLTAGLWFQITSHQPPSNGTTQAAKMPFR